MPLDRLSGVHDRHHQYKPADRAWASAAPDDTPQPLRSRADVRHGVSRNGHWLYGASPTVAIEDAMDDFIEVATPTMRNRFSRNLGQGEAGVLDLALERQADLLLMDDRKARNEAQSLGFACALTSDVLRYAEQQGLVDYQAVVDALRHHRIYLP